MPGIFDSLMPRYRFLGLKTPSGSPGFRCISLEIRAYSSRLTINAQSPPFIVHKRLQKIYHRKNTMKSIYWGIKTILFSGSLSCFKETLQGIEYQDTQSDIMIDFKAQISN